MAASLCFMPVWRSIEFYLALWGDKFMPVRRRVSTFCLCSGLIVNFYLRLCGGRLCLCGGRFAVICFSLACLAVSCEFYLFSRLCGDKLLPV